ncbi:hypothetical protein FHS82_002298 [Pseudochelatococcus lubricantis]|uniref:DUF3035 domain-containing protein n=1 Tax=Pseudochelatococcus lubricantis TaxID=1538102 RepID=A0ABX0V3R3_9HYPH|nr:hypothetical protein [Pseudochelatococcus lubricantis]NIJ58450.1 hypothetical protein [Pseudochelatococcus lubricantis]
MMNVLRQSTPAAALILVLGACAGCSGNGPVRSVAVASGFATQGAKSADFVEQSRPGALEYKPVGVKPPDRGHAPLNADELRTLETSLDQRRTRNESEAATAKALGNTPMAQPPVIPPLE